MRILSSAFALVLIIGLASCGKAQKDICGCSEYSSKSVEKVEGEVSAKAGEQKSCNACKPSGSAHSEGVDSMTHAERAGNKSCTACHTKP